MRIFTVYFFASNAIRRQERKLFFGTVGIADVVIITLFGFSGVDDEN